MSDLRELYQEIILDHYKRPRNFGRLPSPSCTARGDNPLCGDEVQIDIQLDGDRIDNINFSGQGCAISTAAASTMTAAVKGRSIGEARRLFSEFRALVTGTVPNKPDELGELQVFSGIAQFPARVKCATLAWHTLNAALEESNDVVTTE